MVVKNIGAKIAYDSPNPMYNSNLDFDKIVTNVKSIEWINQIKRECFDPSYKQNVEKFYFNSPK